ncbi:uncharacterized protein LOC123885096 isoform X2 [Trifolium pratense]|uniref:uncharacterized protein LOC123885096 isoform X2 n=1 Tax=Trifolium pratense TaxID=57577 RepID=UPI001E696C88|nr:uncharacterized protein LOC123885096 isoform X2 [Trifolium pratense]
MRVISILVLVQLFLWSNAHTFLHRDGIVWSMTWGVQMKHGNGLNCQRNQINLGEFCINRFSGRKRCLEIELEDGDKDCFLFVFQLESLY